MLTRLVRNSLRLVPGGRRLGSRINRRRLAGKSTEDVFTSIYRSNAWESGESVSGAGSTMVETMSVRSALPKLLRDLGARSVLDIPCGDFNWMQALDLDGIDYTGADIVAALVERNRAEFERPGVRFVQLDLLTDTLPPADVVLVRDCLGHLSNADVRRALRRLATSVARHVLMTTHAGRGPSPDIATGQWRPIDLQAPPFGLPAPRRLIDERCPQAGFADKALGLWDVVQLASVLDDDDG